MDFSIIQIVQSLILASMVLSAFLLVRSKNLFVSVVYLAVMSLMLAIEFYILQAPDVAIAEAAVGTALSTAIFVIVIQKTNRFEK